MSKTLMHGVICREFESEAPAAEENVRPCQMQQRTVQLSDVPSALTWKLILFAG